MRKESFRIWAQSTGTGTALGPKYTLLGYMDYSGLYKIVGAGLRHFGFGAPGSQG